MTVGSDRADGRAQRKDRRAAAKGDHGELPHLRRTEADPSSPSLESAANAKWAGEGSSATGCVFALDPKTRELFSKIRVRWGRHLWQATDPSEPIRLHLDQQLIAVGERDGLGQAFLTSRPSIHFRPTACHRIKPMKRELALMRVFAGRACLTTN